MEREIKSALRNLEQECAVKMLFAVESGSREWGFASEDSDYDVRSVHCGRLEAYLGLFPPRENIEVKETSMKPEFDIVSWDIRKFASLLLKSNPTVSEWLQSKILYIDSPYRPEFKEIFASGFSPFALKKHYVNLAKRNYEKYVRGKEEVNPKKYVYILRGLACVEYLMAENKMPPLNYKEVIGYLPDSIAAFMESIVESKRSSESLTGQASEEANSFIESYFGKKFEKTEGRFDKRQVSDLVVEVIKNFND